jgi:hypothetical protein
MVTWAECPPRPVEGMLEEALIQNALAYAARHELRLAERLGFGVHGIIHVAEHKPHGGRTAIKAHREPGPYRRERAAYERLRQARVTEVLGFNVPQFIRADDELRVVEMTIVARPFVLDFAGAYLDQRSDFSEEAWAAWESEKREQFDRRWPDVLRVLAALEEFGIYMLDVSPGNIAFAD